MNDKTNTVVTRFAPSPTGFLHIGGVRTALYAYLLAKQQQGTFILRIEDTDKSREVAGAIEHIQESLRWLGLAWDYGPDTPGPFGPCLQSDRLSIYKAYAERLIAKGLAYPDPYTEEEITAFREQAQRENRPFLFREHRPDTFLPWDGTRALRLKVPTIKRYHWHDVVQGNLSGGEEMLDDFILIKADGYPTYNFAHIVDDLEMGVTHVMRGQEFIASTPKYLSLYEALEITPPVFVTLPPIMGPDGKKKLSKRDGAKDLLEYRDEGYLPEALKNFLALIGWNPGGDQEILTEADLIKLFSLEKIQRSGGAFNEEKARWMNKEHLKLRSQVEREAYVLDALTTVTETAWPQFSPERATKLTDTILERTATKQEIRTAAEAGEYDWAFATPTYDTSLLQWKNDTEVQAVFPRLEHVLVLLETVPFDTPETIKGAVWSYAEEVGKGEVLWPLRTALSGKQQSPDPFTLAYVLGREETLARLTTACAKIRR